jgi:phosphonate transport system ATP-binding protein
MSIGRAEMVALIGASGSGKSTLLRHIAGLLDADRQAGEARVSVFGAEIQSSGRLSRHCRRIRADVGFVFQQFNLVNRLSVMTNVLLGTLGAIPAWRGSLGLFSEEERHQALNALRRVGIADVALQRASTLSGGQQQRAAIARTLVQQAKLVLADEPIASLDPASATKVMEALAAINREDGITVLVSLHQVDYAIRYCPRTIAMLAGRIVYDGPSSALTPAFLADLYGSESKNLLGGAEISDISTGPFAAANLAYVH